MCGICGMFRKDQKINKEIFEQMVDIVTYRGPDDRGAGMTAALRSDTDGLLFLT